jgi:NitT/TauT family transport system permease protein
LVTQEKSREVQIEMKASREPRPRLRRLVTAYGYPVGTAAFVLLAWEILVRLLQVPHYVLPPPSEIVREGVRGFFPMLPHYGITFYEALVGFVCAILVAIPAGLLLSYSPFVRRSFYPLLVFVDEIPKVAFAPILITWFGFGLEPKMILTFINCFFPIFLNSMVGFTFIEEEFVNLGRSAGAREWEMFWKIRLPHALPNVFVGLRMAAAVAMTGAVVSEFLAADRGLGLFLQKALSVLNLGLGFATIFAMWTIGMLFFYGMTLIEARVIHWHVSQRREEEVMSV